MRLLDEQYTKRPHHGVPKLTARIYRRKVNAEDGIIRHLSQAQDICYGQTVESVSLSAEGLSITRPNQVWATDITYIRLNDGFVYLVMDWFSRYVLSWESNSLDVFFCLSALERALSQESPLIFNNDQGSQFTSEAFTGRLEASNIAISWNGRGSYFDNIFIERLWRSVKYEEVYLNDYDSMNTAHRRFHLL